MIQGSLLPPYNPFISSIWGEDLISTQKPKNSLCQEKVNCEGSSLTFKVFGQKMTFKDQYHQYMDVKVIWPKKFKEIHQGAKSRELGFLKAW
jgi:hypothetical protein